MIFLIICVICTSALGVIFKFIENSQLNISKVIIINYLFCVIIGLLTLGGKLIPTKMEWWHGMSFMLGALFITGFNLFGHSVQKSGLSITTLFQKMSVIITVWAAFVLGENLQLLQITGLFLILISMILIFHDPKRPEVLTSKYSIAILLGNLIISAGIEITFMLINKINANFENLSLLLPTYVFFFAGIIGLIILFFKEKRISFQKNEMITGCLLGIPNFYSIYFMVKSLDSGMKGSLFFPYLNCGVIVLSVLISFILFKEKFSALKVLGILLAIIAIYLIQAFM